jgi:hypothetical protein
MGVFYEGNNNLLPHDVESIKISSHMKKLESKPFFTACMFLVRTSIPLHAFVLRTRRTDGGIVDDPSVSASYGLHNILELERH